MSPLGIAGVVVVGAAFLVVLLWYVHARTMLANNPNLIEAGAGSVKGGLFLRLTRRYGEDRGLAQEEALQLAAAVVCVLYGEEPKDASVLAYLQARAEAVEQELRALASEPERVRVLVTDALHFRTRLPARGGRDPTAASGALERATELGILVPGRERTALWGFVKEAARFLSEENRLSKERRAGPSTG